MNMVIAVAAGGAVGAVARFLVMSGIGRVFGHHAFPWGTLTVNVAGSLLMGLLVEVMALVWSPSQEVRALLTVGVLGGFTTFSTFSLDIVVMLQRGQAVLVGLYICLSVLLCVAGLYAGLHLMRGMLR